MHNEAIAVRAYTVPQKKKKWNGPSPPKISKIPDRVLVFDTETRTDLYQNLLFGDIPELKTIKTGRNFKQMKRWK